MAEINMEQIRQYNANLKKYQDQANELNAQIKIYEDDLRRRCSELSQLLGIEVTPQNLESILQERIEKINATMQIGNEIIAKIQAEEMQEETHGNGVSAIF